MAGQHAFSRANELIVQLLVVIGACLATLLIAGLLFDFHGRTLVLIEVAVIGLMVLTERRLGAEIGRWQRGAEGERKVGAILGHLNDENGGFSTMSRSGAAISITY